LAHTRAMTWKTLASKTLVKDQWIDLRADTCITPRGTEIAPYYVLDYPDWVHIVAITKADDLVLVQQYRHAAGIVCLELPGGMMEAGEHDPKIAAMRELEEDTGYRSADIKLVSSLYPNPAIQSNRLHTFLALGVEGSGTRRLDTGEEGLTVHTRPVREVISQLTSGVLPQSLHVASLLLALSVSGHLSLRSP
jgi:8-oxo-dGTP pyrophosphatase MutT (NUDIX family)